MREVGSYEEKLTLFPASGLLQIVTIDLVHQFPHMKLGLTMVIRITDHFPKLLRAILLHKSSAPLVTTEFVKNEVMPYRILDITPPKMDASSPR